MSIQHHPRSSSLQAASLVVVGTLVSFVVGYGFCKNRCQQLTRNSQSTKSEPVDDKQQQQHNAIIPAALLETSLRAELELAVALALRAGHRMKAHLNTKGTTEDESEDLGIAFKGQPEDFCTLVDVENERTISQGIVQHFPTHRIIGEESVGTGVIPPLSTSSAMEPTWIVDPIDGTTNFAAGLPLTCVSIGLCIQRRPVLGVVYAPATEELYLAVAGAGAYRNGARILLRHHPSRRVMLRDAVVGFEFGYARDPTAVDRMVQVVARILHHGCRTMRSLGSGVLDLCYVATGRLDVVYAGVAGEGWKPWDYCAGVLIVQEAGGVVQAIAQSPAEKHFDLYSESIICAVNASLLEEVREKITGGGVELDA